MPVPTEPVPAEPVPAVVKDGESPEQPVEPKATGDGVVAEEKAADDAGVVSDADTAAGETKE